MTDYEYRVKINDSLIDEMESHVKIKRVELDIATNLLARKVLDINYNAQEEETNG